MTYRIKTNILHGAQYRYLDFGQFLNVTPFKISDFLYFTFMKTYTVFYSMPIIESLIRENFQIFQNIETLIFDVDNRDKFFYLVHLKLDIYQFLDFS